MTPVSKWLSLANDAETPLDPGDIEPGTSVLVAGPAMTGKRDLMLDIVQGSRDSTACLVTTKKSAARIRQWFEVAVPDAEDWDLTILDCVGATSSFAASAETDVVTISSPRDMTGIGIKLTGFLQRQHTAGTADARIGFHSLSTLLMYTDLGTVYRFGHVINSRINTAGAIGAFTLDTTSRNAEAVETLSGVFDALVEVETDETGRKLRVKGDSFGPSSWTYFGREQ